MTSRLAIGSADQVDVVVVKSPYLSVMSLFGSARHPTSLLGSHPKTFSSRSCLAVQTLLPRWSHVPDLVASPMLPYCDSTMADQVGVLRGASPHALQTDIGLAFAEDVPENWRPAMERPDQWIDSLVSASLEAWSLLNPYWDRAQSLLDREIARAGTAAVRGGMSYFLNSLHPRLHMDGDVLKLGNGCHSVAELGDRKLALVPMIHGSKVMVSFDLPGLAYVAYPIPGLARLNGSNALDGQEVSSSHLSSLIGPVRADILRILRVPMTMGQVATRIDCLPRTVTYHCSALETAGLVVRERRGQLVVASLTAHGEELLDLFLA
ncbi:MAG TPA: winged helix-turn-helix domain-containing protein [Acidimicrobiales bacterium]|jgi:DNA-binding transcriptional ArsR family regulator|nr:winged helix-turn-helix domain-containing protein [Acidimicrobiales bacterium]